MGVVDHIHGVAKGSAKMLLSFNRGVKTIQMNSNKGFASLSEAARDSVLRKLEAQNSEFFDQLISKTDPAYSLCPPRDH